MLRACLVGGEAHVTQFGRRAAAEPGYAPEVELAEGHPPQLAALLLAGLLPSEISSRLTVADWLGS